MTTIAELFVSIGITGSEKTIGAVTGLKKNLGEAKDTAFETKAALVGVMYALERLFAASGKAGTDLTNFNATVGVSTKILQQYQWAGKQVGLSFEETAGSFRSLQGLMAKANMGLGAPAGMARVAMLTGGISPQAMKNFADQPQLLINKLQEYSAKETNKALRNETLKTFGLSSGFLDALNRQAFKPEILQRAPTYSDKEVGALDRANIGWSNLGNTIEMAIGHFNAAHGGSIVKDITALVGPTIKLAEAFEKLSTSAHVFEIIGTSIKGWVEIIQGLTSAIQYIMSVKEPSNPSANKEHAARQLNYADVMVGSANSPAEAEALGMKFGIGPAESQAAYYRKMKSQRSTTTSHAPEGSTSSFPEAGPHMAAGGPVSYFAGGGPVYLGSGGSASSDTWSYDEIQKAIKGGKNWRIVDGNAFGNPHSYISPSGYFYKKDRLGNDYHMLSPDTDPDDFTSTKEIWENHFKSMGKGMAAGGVPSYFAAGGGPKGHDDVPAWLDKREYVLNPGMVGQVGVGNLEKWRKDGKMPRHFADGGMADYARPSVSGLSAGGNTHHVEVNQNLNFQHEGKDAHRTGDSTKKAIKEAFRQLTSQAQGS